jgi:hypothetical protein
MTGRITREIAENGTVILGDERCRFEFRRIRPGALEIRIVGVDNGQFGTAMFAEVTLALMRERSLELFVDATSASMPAVSVTKGWSQFITLNREDLKCVRILVGSKAVALTMEIVRHVSKAGDLMRIYSDRGLYDARKAAAEPSP